MIEFSEIEVKCFFEYNRLKYLSSVELLAIPTLFELTYIITPPFIPFVFAITLSPISINSPSFSSVDRNF